MIMTQTQTQERKWHYTTEELKAIRVKSPLQVIEAYRTWNGNGWKQTSIGIIAMNHNESNKPNFSSQLHLQGICYGLSAKYKHPYVICWEIDENGEKTMLNAQGF